MQPLRQDTANLGCFHDPDPAGVAALRYNQRCRLSIGSSLKPIENQISLMSYVTFQEF